MRRTLAGLLFALACSCAGIAISGFWLQRVAFTPGQSGDLAAVVLEDSAIKQELIDVIAASSAQQLGLAEADVRSVVATVAENPEGAELLGSVIEDAHARLIGARDEPVTIDGEELVNIVRTDAAADLSVTLPVPRVAALAVAREVLRWLVPIAAIATVVFVGLGILAHPDKLEVLRTLGFGLLLLTVLLVLVGYVIPAVAVPRLSDNPWIGVAPRLARDALPFLLGLALLMVGGGLGCLAATGAARRNRRWSQPIRVQRYGDERRWN